MRGVIVALWSTYTNSLILFTLLTLECWRDSITSASLLWTARAHRPRCGERHAGTAMEDYVVPQCSQFLDVFLLGDIVLGGCLKTQGGIKDCLKLNKHLFFDFFYAFNLPQTARRCISDVSPMLPINLYKSSLKNQKRIRKMVYYALQKSQQI